MKTKIFSNSIAVGRLYLRSTALFVKGVNFTFLVFGCNVGHCRGSTDDFIVTLSKRQISIITYWL